MSEYLTKALSASLKEHTELSETRHETLGWLIILIIRLGTVSLWCLAGHVKSDAKTLSIHRRLERFFQKVRLDGSNTARLLVVMM